MNYALLIFSAAFLAADFAVNKIYQKKAGTGQKAIFGFNAILGLFTAAVFFLCNIFITKKIGFDFSFYSAIMSALMSLCVMCYNIMGFKIMSRSSVAVYTLSLMSGGMTVPYIVGLLFLGEQFSVFRTAGLVMILAGVVISNYSNQKKNSALIIMCAAVFIINGLTSIISKTHQTQSMFSAVSATEFVILCGIWKFILAGTIYLFVKKKSTSDDTKRNGGILLPTALASAVASGLAFLLQLIGASSLPASVLYPFITGGSIVFSSLISALAFKEKLSKRLVLSVALCFAGTVLFI